MRTTKELLQLTLNEGNKIHQTPKSKRKFCGFTGLCGFTFHYLRQNDIINDIEFLELRTFIKNNKPETTVKNFQGSFDYSHGYYWPVSKWSYRKKWLEHHIKSL